MSYRTLDPQRIIVTAERLERRVRDRFPRSGLSSVACELTLLARDTAEHARTLEAPIVWLRLSVAAIIASGAGIFAFFGTLLTFDRIGSDGFSAVQGIESAINTLVLAGIGFFTLIRLEERLKRRAAFRGLHALRSLIHIIDMHQLTKDPSALSSDFRPTEHSPRRTLGRGELLRYLDYCSEMLSLTGKLAALYAQALNDDVLVDAVNDVEELGSNLSRKIWQKIVLLGPDPAATVEPAAARDLPIRTLLAEAPDLLEPQASQAATPP